jgi:hypothetical protein
MEPRWKVKELNAIDLVPDRKLINVFLTSPKPPQVIQSYQNFKAHKSKTRRLMLFKYDPPPIKPSKVVKYEGPRFCNKLPKTFFKSIRKSQTKSLSPSGRNVQAEVLLENLIKNRQELVFPIVQSTKQAYRSLKDRLSNTKTNLFQNLSSISQSISSGLKTKESQDSPRVNWHHSPIRRWERPKIQKRSENRAKTCFKKRESLPKNERTSNGDLIGGILDNCESAILNWE